MLISLVQMYTDDEIAVLLLLGVGGGAGGREVGLRLGLVQSSR
jgi:hypothetical protein